MVTEKSSTELSRSEEKNRGSGGRFAESGLGIRSSSLDLAASRFRAGAIDRLVTAFRWEESPGYSFQRHRKVISFPSAAPQPTGNVVDAFSVEKHRYRIFFSPLYLLLPSMRSLAVY